MSPLLLACALVLAPLQDAAGARARPSEEDVRRTVAELEAALAGTDLARTRKALEAAQVVPDAAVVEAAARALALEPQEVVLAGLQCLRWNEHPSALESLHKAAKDKRLRRTPALATGLYRAIAWHGDARSIEVLTRDPLEPIEHLTIQARILGLGRIRTKDSVDALMRLLAMTPAQPGPNRRVLQPWMEDFRVSLAMLTGVDQGLEPELWESWWRENKKDLRVAPEPPVLAAALRDRWDRYWGDMRGYGRERRREDRGKD